MSFSRQSIEDSLENPSILWEDNFNSQSGPINSIEIHDFDDQSLVELHKIYGNKWKKISSHYPNKDDSFIKNHFYSLLRRSLRKLNSYIKTKNKQIKQQKVLKLNFIFKVTNLAESERNEISNKKKFQFLLYQFLTLKDENLPKKTEKNDNFSGQYFSRSENSTVERLLECMRQIEAFFLEHNLNKKGKSKKKCPKKLQLRKQIIQKSLARKERNPDQIDEDNLFSPSRQSTAFEMSMIEQQQKLLDFESQQQKGIFNQMIEEQDSYDRALFK